MHADVLVRCFREATITLFTLQLRPLLTVRFFPLHLLKTKFILIMLIGFISPFDVWHKRSTRICIMHRESGWSTKISPHFDSHLSRLFSL